MDPTTTCQTCVTVTGIIATLVPIVIKAAHAAGYEIPFLTWLSDWIANRPQKVTLS